MAFSMLVAMKTEHGLRRGSVMVIAKRFGVACSTINCLWERVESACEVGLINFPEFTSQRKLQKKGYI